MKMKQIIKKLNRYFPLSLRDFTIFLIIMLLTSWLCFALKDISDTDFHVPMIFVLAVLVISLLTNGYFYGSVAAFLSVFAVNWAFTYPYFQMDFSIYGYPLTFLTMLTVGVATSTLATRTKEQDKLRRETEQEKMRANLLRAISHDLRTPLTSISGSITAVLDNDDILSQDEKEQLLLDAKKDSDWLCRMVENLLSITRINGYMENYDGLYLVIASGTNPVILPLGKNLGESFHLRLEYATANAGLTVYRDDVILGGGIII